MSMESAPWSDETKRLVFATVAKNLKPADQALFEAVCRSSGLDPLRKEIYAVSRGGNMSIQTGIDGYLKLANSTKELDGMDVLFYDADGAESEVWLSPKPPVACLVRVYRKGCAHPFAASCRFDAYSQKNQMWSKFPETMLAKCTTTLALRRAFADVISGIASADEMDQADMAAPEALAQGTPAAPAASSAKPRVARQAAPAVKEAAEELARVFQGEVVEEVAEEIEEKPAAKADELPEREDLKGAVGALYKKARLAGVTPAGWAALEKQCGGDITAEKAAKALPALADPAKVANLNKGLATTGAAV